MSDGTREARGSTFEEAIDRAVREMLDVEPRADLRAKVIARIDAPVASAFRRKIWSAAAIASAVALLVVVLFLARRSGPPARPPLQARTGANPVLVAPRPIAPVPIASAAHAPVARTHVARAPAPLVNAGSIETPGSATAIGPLNAITPIDVAPIAQSGIVPEPIAVRPLSSITEIQIAPLNPPDGRD